MTLRISDVRLSVDEPELRLPERLAAVLGVLPGDLLRWRILRKALDARDKDDLQFVYTAEVAVTEEEKRLAARAGRSSHRSAKVDRYEEEAFYVPPTGVRPLAHRPVVIGSGPGGLAAAWFLAEQGYRPLVLERGRAVRDRIHDVQAFDAGGAFDPESNYLFGEGGAGTFSDGKLTCRNSGPDVRRILQLFAECKGKPSMLVRRSAAPGQQPFAGRGQGVAAPRRSAGRRGALFLPRRGSGHCGWPVARIEYFVGLSAGFGGRAGHRSQRPRHLRNAAAPRRADGSESRFSWACASSIRRRRSTA